jgi:hypothetical protein
MQIRIDATTSDDVIRALRTSGSETIHPKSISLGASVELALWRSHSQLTNSEIETWSNDHELLHGAVEHVMSARVHPVQPFAIRDSEYFGINNAAELGGLLFGQYLSRFAAAVRRAGYQDFSQAIAGVLYELADNIPQHSQTGELGRKVCGLVGYAVDDRKIAFVVADDGVGVLSSLRSSREWSHLTTDRDALLAVARDHASRREGQGEGQGYKDLFSVLARFNGLVRLRSNTGIFELRGALDKLNPSGGVGPEIPGLQLTVECNL